MTEFFGLLNDNGVETKFRIFVDLGRIATCNQPALRGQGRQDEYITDFYVDHTRSDAIIYDDKCIIKIGKKSGANYLSEIFFGIDNTETTYDINFRQYGDEIIMSGMETGIFYLSCIPIFSRPIFFVATNKIEV